MSNRFRYLFGALVLLTVLVSACQGAAAPAPGTAPGDEPAAEDQPITLYYVGKSAQVELTSPATDEDILLTSHHHPDHYYPGFGDSFPGQQLDVEEGQITVGDVTVHSIMARHGITNFGAASECDNAIFVIEMGGLRLAHFGDFGQGQFTEEQLSALGEVDVAISLLGNARIFRQLLAEKTMFTLMDQLNPALIIPTDHSDQQSIDYAAQQWNGFYSSSKLVTIRPTDLPAETGFLVLGPLALSYHNLFGLLSWEALAAVP